MSDTSDVQYNLDGASLSDDAWFNSDVWIQQPYVLTAGEFGAATTEGKKEGVRQLLDEFGHMSSDQMRQLQLGLLLGGYDRRNIKDVNMGQRDPGSLDAYKRLLHQAQEQNTTLGELLPDLSGLSLKDLFGRLGGSGGATHTNVVQHLSEEDLNDQLLKGFQAALGHAPSPDQAAAFKAAFRGKETKAQPDTSGGGTFNVTDPGNPGVAAKAFAEQQSPDDAQSYAKLQAFGSILSALGVKGG